MFEGLYEQGKKNNLLLKAQNAMQKSTKQQEKLALAGLLPSVNLLGNWNYQKQKSEIRSDSFLQTFVDRRNQADGFGYDLSVTQPLFNLPAYYNYQRGVRISGRADLENLQAKTIYTQEFSKAYLEVVANWQRVNNINETLSAYEAQRALITQQYESGFAKPSDLQQAHASLATLQAEAIVINNSLNVAFQRLALILQSDVQSLNDLASELENIDVFDKPLIHYLTRFQNNVDYQLANADVEIADKALDVSSSLSMPSLSASLRYSDNHFDNSFDFQAGTTLYQDGLTFALQLRVPLYAGGRDTYQKRASAYSYESSKLQKQFVQHVTQQSIRTTYLNLKAGIASVKARKSSVSASRAALDNANVEYRAGIGQYTEVRNSQDRLYEQTNLLIIDKVSLIDSYFTMANLIGEEPDLTVQRMKIFFAGEVIKNEG
jgi:outer membrane protein